MEQLMLLTYKFYTYFFTSEGNKENFPDIESDLGFLGIAL
jgi:hypothetical protein